MTKITETFHIIDDISFEYSPGVKSSYNVTLLVGKSGLTLFDTGMPGSSKQIERYVNSIGRDLSEIKQVILTHLDNDHIGSAPEIRKETNAKIVMHRLDAVLATDKTVRKDDLRRMFPSYKRDEIDRLVEKISATREIDLQVDTKVEGGERLFAYNEGSDDTVSIFHTPGHTPGHCCAYVGRESILISGDGLSVKEGKTIEDPVPMYTVNMNEARESLRRLDQFGLGFERLVSYHDKPLMASASRSLKEYLQTLEE